MVVTVYRVLVGGDRQVLLACSTTAVHLTVNQRVAGSNPAMPAKFLICMIIVMTKGSILWWLNYTNHEPDHTGSVSRYETDASI